MRAALWRSGARLARGKKGFWPYSFDLLLGVPILGGNLLRVHRLSGHGIAVAKPLREIAILASLRTEGSEFFRARFLADGAGALFTHAAMIWACGASSASPGSVSTRICLPVRRPSSSSHSGLSFALSAGCTLSSRAGPRPAARSGQAGRQCQFFLCPTS